VKKLLWSALLLPLPLFAQSTTYQCTGAVSDLVIAPNGVVTATVGSLQWVELCSVNSGSTFNGVASDACKVVFAHLLAAKTAGNQEAFWFNDGASGGTCTSHTAWQPLTGWYFGPDFQ
jgi:hypothetical protein